ncbi:MAG: SLBB domain-containing protein [Candidatus Eisenbacteria bacterium]
MHLRIGLAITVALLVICTAASAQEPIDAGATPGGAQYYVYLGKNWELQINVYVWGRVARPGMYSVPNTTDLVAVISLAGGPGEHANLKNVRVIRSNPNPEVMTVNVKAYMHTGKPSSIPVLHPGDTVIVSANKSHSFASVVNVFSQIAIIGNVYYLFFLHER